MNIAGNTAFRIGQWRIDPALDEISRDSTTIKLEPRTMRVLVCLAERAGEVVSVSELLDAVWKDLVVTQYSVYQAVAALRRALGDDPKDPSYIANVARRGYRLLPPVEAEAEVQGPQPLPVGRTAGAGLNEQAAAAKDDSQPVVVDATEGGLVAARGFRSRDAAVPIALLVLAATVWWLALGRRHEIPAGVSAVHQPATTVAVDATGTGFRPPPHSVAVLPFTNLSGDPGQEYFSDGMTEELINALSQIDGLKVIARTSSFSFKGKDADIGTIARNLNVAAILEGSVRRSGSKVRITAQLINALNGFHIWSEDYDRDLNNVLILQADIATAVARELQARLLGDEAPRIELGGTRNSAAFDAYLRGARAYSTRTAAKDCQAAIAAYTEAIRLDPSYALAFAGRSSAYSAYAAEFATGAAIREAFDSAQTDARHATALAPELAEGHVALGNVLYYGSFDFRGASAAYERAQVLAPGNAQVLGESGRFAVFIGHSDAGIAAARRAAVLDPLNPRSHSLLAQALYFARRYQEAIAAFTEVISLDPEDEFAFGHRGLAYYGLGDLQSARSSCETKSDHWATQWCLAVTYDKLGRDADAETILTKMMTAFGDAAAYQYASIYAQWGNVPKSLEWLDKAMRRRDPGLVHLKTDPLLDPVRKEARFQAIERQLKYPKQPPSLPRPQAALPRH